VRGEFRRDGRKICPRLREEKNRLSNFRLSIGTDKGNVLGLDRCIMSKQWGQLDNALRLFCQRATGPFGWLCWLAGCPASLLPYYYAAVRRSRLPPACCKSFCDCKKGQKETRAEREETAFPVYVQTGSTSLVRAHQPKERDGSGTEVET
jgi:hypothetical protein